MNKDTTKPVSNEIDRTVAAPLRRYLQLMTDHAEAVAGIQLAAMKAYSELGFRQLQAAVDVTDAKAFQAYMSNQSDVAKQVGERVKADAEKLSAANRTLVESVRNASGNDQPSAQDEEKAAKAEAKAARDDQKTAKAEEKATRDDQKTARAEAKAASDDQKTAKAEAKAARDDQKTAKAEEKAEEKATGDEQKTAQAGEKATTGGIRKVPKTAASGQ